jgi:hypothetical protein
VLIPLAAVVNGKVKVKRKDKTELIPVKIRKTSDGLAEVLDGDISGGDLVIVPSTKNESSNKKTNDFR